MPPKKAALKARPPYCRRCRRCHRGQRHDISTAQASAGLGMSRASIAAYAAELHLAPRTVTRIIKVKTNLWTRDQLRRIVGAIKRPKQAQEVELRGKSLGVL